MTEKSFPLGNFLIKLNCNFITRELSQYNTPVMSAIYTLSFWTQDNITCIAEIPIPSEIFFDIVDIFRWSGIDGAFMYTFPPAKLFEQYCLCIGYIDEEQEFIGPKSPIEFCLFKTIQTPMKLSEEEILDVIITQYEFEQFVEFLIDYSFCAEGHESL